MNKYSDVIGKVIRFMEDNLREEISIVDIARESIYSTSHFTRLFMAETGETPGAYLRKRRLEEAARDILAGKKILDAAIDYHFGSQEAFTRSFKMQFNITPGFYVKLGADLRVGTLNREKEVDMTKSLENLRWPSRWNTLLGCTKGCIDYLGIDITDAWLYGATGYAFVMNMRETEACGSSPDTWMKQRVYELGNNIGYKTDTIFAIDSQEDFSNKLEEAWIMVRESIDQSIPCFGWEVGYPGYQVITGYDDTGYYYSGPDGIGDGHKAWQRIGETELSIGMIQMHAIRQARAADDTKTVKEALEFALEHARNPSKWVFPEYRSGLTGYDMWIKAVENGTALTEGMAYNSAFWAECRGLGAHFLREAGERLDGKSVTHLKKAADQYEMISQHLERISELYPFTLDEESEYEDRSRKAVKYLKQAKDAEKIGLELLENTTGIL